MHQRLESSAKNLRAYLDVMPNSTAGKSVDAFLAGLPEKGIRWLGIVEEVGIEGSRLFVCLAGSLDKQTPILRQDPSLRQVRAETGIDIEVVYRNRTPQEIHNLFESRRRCSPDIVDTRYLVAANIS